MTGKLTEEEIVNRLVVHGHTYVSHNRIPSGKGYRLIVTYLCQCGNQEHVKTDVNAIKKTCKKCKAHKYTVSDETIKARITADGNTYTSHSRIADKHGHIRIIVRYMCKCGNKNEVESVWTKHAKTCKDCKSEAVKATCLTKYGSASPLQNSKVAEKTKATMNEKFGCDHALQNADIMEKLKATNMERYGCDNPLKNEEVREKVNSTNVEKYGCENPFGNLEIQEKIKETNVEKYGCEHITQNADIRDRIKETNLEKFGCVSSLQNPEVIEKAKATMRERYGCDHPLRSREIRERIKTTNMERYGYEHPMQNTEVFAKSKANMYRTHQFTFPSGRVVDYQGYERLAYEVLLYVYDIPEDDILVESDIQSRLPPFKYTMNGKTHVYNPDIFIWSQQKVIEVKSSWTATLNPEKIELKKQCILAMGYKYEMWIMDAKTGEPTIIC